MKTLGNRSRYQWAAWAALTLGVAAPRALRAETPKPAATAPEPPAAIQHVQAATALAKSDLTTPLFLCRADSLSVVKQNLETSSKKWVEPTQAFDNLYYSSDEAEHHLVPGRSSG
jgi:hypothetical protein